MSRRPILVVAAAVAAMAQAGPLWALCGSSTGCPCTASATGVNFGVYNPLGSSANDSVGTVTMSCTGNNQTPASFQISLDAGVSGNVAQRTLRSGNSVLQYNLYKNAGRTSLWGNDTGGGGSLVDVRPPGSSFDRDYPIYARIPARQNVVAGNYQDMVLVTITY